MCSSNSEYSYTGGFGTDTLTGVTPDASGIRGTPNIFQSVGIIENTNILDLPDDNKNTAVEILDNQLYIASDENIKLATCL